MAKLSPKLGLLMLVLGLVLATDSAHNVSALDGPTMLHPRLTVQAVITGLHQPTSIAFLGDGDFLVLEKSTGQVKRIVHGEVDSTPLDLSVNFAGERGLLDIALHPDFPDEPFVYLFWTESTTGSDSGVVSDTPVLGNRVDRFVWNAGDLSFDKPIVSMRAVQNDADQSPRGDNNGGAIGFGPDGMLYVFLGDVGRRGQMQNLPCGPTAACPNGTVSDDQYGGPEPDDAHLTGVILRLDANGGAPEDNPFFGTGASMGGEIGANIQKIFSYGHANSFDFSFDPKSGALWLPENGDDAFTELNRVDAGMNGGWVQIAGPVARIADYKAIETTFGAGTLGGQLRWPPANIADTPAEALSRLFMLPGASYKDPELSWKWDIASTAIGFVTGRGLGPQFDGHLLMGAGGVQGYLLDVPLAGPRRQVTGKKVIENSSKLDLAGSGRFLIGEGFGFISAIETAPNSNVYVVSQSNGAIYEISRR